MFDQQLNEVFNLTCIPLHEVLASFVGQLPCAPVTAGRDVGGQAHQIWTNSVRHHRADDHQAPHAGPIQCCQFCVRCSLREQYKLDLRRHFRQAVQQFQHENLRAPVFPAGEDGGYIHGDGAE